MSADQLDLFAQPTARATDIDTAHRAAVIAIGRAAGNRALALRALYDAGEGGMTDFALADAVTVLAGRRVIQTSVGCRRNELVKAGLVCRAFRLDPVTGDRVPLNGVSPMGSPAARWELTPTGCGVVEAWAVDGAA